MLTLLSNTQFQDISKSHPRVSPSVKINTWVYLFMGVCTRVILTEKAQLNNINGILMTRKCLLMVATFHQDVSDKVEQNPSYSNKCSNNHKLYNVFYNQIISQGQMVPRKNGNNNNNSSQR